MRHANFITLYVGLWILGGYIVGSLARNWVRPDPDRAESGESAIRQLVVEGLVAAIWAALTYAFIDAVAPGTDDFRNTSAIGFLSAKALTVWESAALWSGLATVLGSVAPFPSRGRFGSHGLAGATALLVAYSPITLLISAAVVFAATNMTRSLRTGLLVGYLSIAGTEWVLSMTRIRLGIGLINGPETSLWAAGLAALLIARWSHDSSINSLD